MTLIYLLGSRGEHPRTLNNNFYYFNLPATIYDENIHNNNNNNKNNNDDVLVYCA
jgi:hypothetical protein